MKCERCGEEPATVHQITVTGGFDVHYKHLCEKCAAELEATGAEETEGKVPGLINSMFEEPEAAQCDECGLEFSEFSKTGRLGCANCYLAFFDHLEPLIKRIHGAGKHSGETAEGGELGELSMARKIQILQQELKEAVESEKYEEAARLRDRINDLKGELTGAAAD
ncbi:MAG: UvrB/UvrC motif-containing protein [bacterium]